ncbi:cytochrome P450 [Aspergillus luchuensis]|uniref:Cytochrome P450 n=1 Tax=Aspergillus kawachii TaxID=1069201 RepID=A0A146F7U5_ASPKA|nr:cytochrome P450 [Aspergillus luchuensis]
MQNRRRIMQDIHCIRFEGVAILGTAEERAGCRGKGCWEAAVGDKPGRGNHRRRRTSGGVSGEDSSVCQSYVSATSKSSGSVFVKMLKRD